jgi:HlyD family secretion protein
MSALPASPPAAPPERQAPRAVPPTSIHPKKPSNWIWIVATLLAVTGAFFAYRALTKPSQASPTAASVKTVKAFVGPLDVTLRVTGQTAARNFANITAPMLRGPENRGSLVLLDLAKAGLFVKKGQIIGRLDAQTAQDHIDDLKDTIAAASNDVQKRAAEQKVEWENMQQTLRVAKAQLDKAKLEYGAGVIKTDIERELLKLDVDEADARYTQQQKDVAFRKAAQDAELRILQLTLERHKRHMGRHAHDLQRYTITAPMDGLVVMASVFRGGEMAQIQQGDQVFPGQQILKVVDIRSMQVEGSVSQSDSGELRLSQRAGVGLDAFPDMKFAGKVYSLGALAVGGWRQNYYIRSVPVRIQIQGSDPRLIPDLSAHCDIVLDTVPNQLQVPAGAIQDENGKTFVNVRSGDGFERREVKLGKKSFTYVAVVSGLKAGEEVRLL